MLHEVNLAFYLDEEVTPELFAKKIAFACARSGALRKGERIGVDEFLYEYEGDIEGVDVFGNGKVVVTMPAISQVHP